MPIIFKKSLRDMTSRLPSTLVAILALTIGLWGVGTLLVSMHILINDLPENFSSTAPSHVTIVSKSFEKLNLEDLRKRADMESAEFRGLASLRIEVRPDVWLPLKLQAISNPGELTIEKYFKQTGSARLSNNGILIERDIRKVSKLATGQSARVQSAGKTLDVTITGVVFDPGRAPSTQDAVVYGYASKEYFAKLTGTPVNQRLIVRFNNVQSIKDVEARFKELSTSFAQQGIAIDHFKIPRLNEHPHQFQLNTLLYLNGTIGLLAFVMAMVLVSQLMNSIFARQIRQIGIMKAVGATRAHIFKSYAGYILTMSAVSIIIGVPAAIFTGKFYSSFVADIINFDILTTQLPISLYLALIVFGFALPVVFSLPALLKGTNVSVLDAISDYGIKAESTGSSTKSASLGNSGILNLAIRNLGRRKGRMLVTMITMALGVAIFLTGFNVRTSLREFLDASSASMKSDIIVVMKKGVPGTKAMESFKAIKGVKSVEGQIAGEIQIWSATSPTAKSFHLSAAPYDSKLKDNHLLKGTWLTGATDLEFVINQQAALEMQDVVVGDNYTLMIGKKAVPGKLVGVVREFSSAAAYVDITKFNNAFNPEQKINKLMLSMEDRSYENVIGIKKQVESVIQRTGMDVVFVISQAEQSVVIFEHLNIILSILVFFSLLVLTVSAMGMGSAMGINVMERTREIGVLRAIGATPKMTTRLFVLEGFVISAISVIVGVILALPLSWLASIFFGDLILGDETPLDFAFSIPGFAVTLAITLAFGYIASRLPANKATKITVREAIAYE